MTKVRTPGQGATAVTSLLHSRRDSVAVLTLNRPDRLNTLTEELICELQTELESIGRDETIRAVVISGAGQAFCAGVEIGQASTPL